MRIGNIQEFKEEQLSKAEKRQKEDERIRKGVYQMQMMIDCESMEIFDRENQRSKGRTAISREAVREAESQRENRPHTKTAEQLTTLHWFENEDGDTPIGASAVGSVDGSSVTVYKPKDFDPSNPVYKVKIWDAAGNVTERMVDIAKVDPKACDAIDMFAYASHLTVSSECPNAQSAFMGVAADFGMSNGGTGLFDMTNWLGRIKNMMQMQYDAGNLKGYLDYKSFWDRLTE